MTRFITSEGSKTAWGGRTLKVEIAPPPPVIRYWSADDDAHLLAARKSGVPYPEIAQALGRSIYACYRRYQLLRDMAA